MNLDNYRKSLDPEISEQYTDAQLEIFRRETDQLAEFLLDFFLWKKEITKEEVTGQQK